jgi:hypothetical protein
MVLWGFGPMANAGRSKRVNREEAQKLNGIRFLFSSGGAATVYDGRWPGHQGPLLSWNSGLMDNLDLLLEFR